MSVDCRAGHFVVGSYVSLAHEYKTRLHTLMKVNVGAMTVDVQRILDFLMAERSTGLLSAAAGFREVPGPVEHWVCLLSLEGM